jgi:hypothetical protein
MRMRSLRCHQTVAKGEACDFSQNIPECDVDSRNGLGLSAHHTQLVGTVKHLVPEPVDVERILAENNRHQSIFQHRDNDSGIHRAALSETRDALVGAYQHKDGASS